MANSIKTCREKAGLTQKQVALTLKISVQAVSYWENGDRIPSLENAVMLADLYKCSLDALLGRVEYKEKPAVKDGELDEKLVNLLLDLSPDEAQRVADFVAGLKASRTK